jgi:tetratricopeptide (TPR) repeat protein
MARDRSTILRKAEKHIQHGKIAHAIREYLDLIEQEPDDSFALNTIGDLYLTQGNTEEACRHFGRAVEQCARQKAASQAIPICKKIVNTQPENLAAHVRLAELFGSHGSGLEASRQWLRLSDMYAASGKAGESRAALEKACAADPANPTARVQLAERFLAEGDQGHAQTHFIEAGGLQSKAGDFKSAAVSYGRALQLNPQNLEMLEALLDVSLRLGDVALVMEQIQRAISSSPENPTLQAMLGRAYLATGDLKGAADIFQSLLSRDESFYADLLRIGKSCLEEGDLNLASTCIDQVMPTLINRRQIEQGLEAYNRILKADPRHIPTLTGLAAAYSNVCNLPRQIEVLEKLTECHLKQNPKEALKCIKEILQSYPEDEKYLAKHRQVFALAFPGIKYAAPTYAATASATDGTETSADASEGDLVEIDLLVNYGMREKAIERLISFTSADPGNAELRRKLASLYEETGQRDKAEKQRRSLISREKEGAGRHPQTSHQSAAPGSPAAAAGFHPDDRAKCDETAESPRDNVPTQRMQPESLEEQLRQVDFLARLGFHEEAQYRLDKLAREYPDNPALGLRLQMSRPTPR